MPPLILPPVSRDLRLEDYFMQQALKVARDALEVGEVPVGCVIVLRDAPEADATKEKYEQVESSEICNDNFSNEAYYLVSPSVIVSHGANQVNATRDATRHAEIVAIDRMLTAGVASDSASLPQSTIIKAEVLYDQESLKVNHIDKVENSGASGDEQNVRCEIKPILKWNYGWGSGRIFNSNFPQECDLYVTCEPCIMVGTQNKSIDDFTRYWVSYLYLIMFLNFFMTYQNELNSYTFYQPFLFI